jgi:hypothetical protein
MKNTYASKDAAVPVVLCCSREARNAPRDHTDIVDSHIAAEIDINLVATVPCPDYLRSGAAERRMRREIVLVIRCWVEERNPRRVRNVLPARKPDTRPMDGSDGAPGVVMISRDRADKYGKYRK